MGADKVVWRRVKDSNLRAGCPTICFRGSATKPLWELAVIELVRRAGLEPATSWVETRNSGSAELTPRDRYTHLGSNQGPPLCKSGALPAELCVHARICWPGRFRTCARSVNSGVLYQLSYWPMQLVHRAGFEPATSWASTRRSTS